MSAPLRTLLFCLIAIPLQSYGAANVLDEVVVTATKAETRLGNTAASIGVIDDAVLRQVRHTHINEVLQRVPGVWISRGNGQEHLTAIRSPVLTGAGSCGAFVMAQDGISLRSPGFCNVNELFEATTELASRIEVVRGPDSSIYGSNAMHGVVNILTPDPVEDYRELEMESGPNDYYRARLSLSTDTLRLDVSGATDGGYKDESGFDQQKMLLKHRAVTSEREITTTFSFTNLNQETAGFIRGYESYKDSGQKRGNPNPEAYRDARSFRLVAEIDQQLGMGSLLIKPYLRHVEMEFLQHFLPGQASEENGHDSVGVSLLWNPDSWWQAGVDLEYTDAFLEETQPGPTQGSPFLVATIPQGKHYDYDVNASLAGLFLSASKSLNDALLLSGSIRYQYTGYDYNNRMIDGRTRDDGTACGFGGCRFSRPADRDDSFTNWSPRVGLIYSWSDAHQVFASLSQGFRAPQATELYRLQNSQNVADIDPVEMDSIEMGFRGNTEKVGYNIALFSMRKDNFIFRNTSRQNVDNGATEHRGIEFDIQMKLHETMTANLAFSWAEHEYDNNPALSVTPLKGNTIDTAPETLGSMSIKWQATPRQTHELEWVHIGEYYEDPENLNEYEGHDLLHLRGNWRMNSNVQLFYKIMNLTDEAYAERADFAFGSDRYFVGTPRSVYLGLTLTL
ncbi:MAG: TonB-dependent receptor [Candidatus Azotimanducaceae bacterium WSBS_2022_MAG_OTU7]